MGCVGSTSANATGRHVGTDSGRSVWRAEYYPAERTRVHGAPMAGSIECLVGGPRSLVFLSLAQATPDRAKVER